MGRAIRSERTSSAWSAVATMSATTSAASTAEAIDSAPGTPSAATSAVRSGRTSYPRTTWPERARHTAIGAPIEPRPSQPTRNEVIVPSRGSTVRAVTADGCQEAIAARIAGADRKRTCIVRVADATTSPASMRARRPSRTIYADRRRALPSPDRSRLPRPGRDSTPGCASLAVAAVAQPLTIMSVTSVTSSGAPAGANLIPVRAPVGPLHDQAISVECRNHLVRRIHEANVVAILQRRIDCIEQRPEIATASRLEIVPEKLPITGVRYGSPMIANQNPALGLRVAAACSATACSVIVLNNRSLARSI
jgi:hypothetical protein